MLAVVRVSSAKVPHFENWYVPVLYHLDTAASVVATCQVLGSHVALTLSASNYIWT